MCNIIMTGKKMKLQDMYPNELGLEGFKEQYQLRRKARKQTQKERNELVDNYNENLKSKEIFKQFARQKYKLEKEIYMINIEIITLCKQMNRFWKTTYKTYPIKEPQPLIRLYKK